MLRVLRAIFGRPPSKPDSVGARARRGNRETQLQHDRSAGEKIGRGERCRRRQRVAVIPEHQPTVIACGHGDQEKRAMRVPPWQASCSEWKSWRARVLRLKSGRTTQHEKEATKRKDLHPLLLKPNFFVLTLRPTESLHLTVSVMQQHSSRALYGNALTMQD